MSGVNMQGNRMSMDSGRVNGLGRMQSVPGLSVGHGVSHSAGKEGRKTVQSGKQVQLRDVKKRGKITNPWSWVFLQVTCGSLSSQEGLPYPLLLWGFL